MGGPDPTTLDPQDRAAFEEALIGEGPELAPSVDLLASVEARLRARGSTAFLLPSPVPRLAAAGGERAERVFVSEEGPAARVIRHRGRTRLFLTGVGLAALPVDVQVWRGEWHTVRVRIERARQLATGVVVDDVDLAEVTGLVLSGGAAA